MFPSPSKSVLFGTPRLHSSTKYAHKVYIKIINLQTCVTFSCSPPQKICLMSHEKGPFQKTVSSSNHHFSGDMLAFRGDSSSPWSAGEPNFFLPKGQSTAYRVRCTTPRIARPQTVWSLAAGFLFMNRGPTPPVETIYPSVVKFHVPQLVFWTFTKI